MSAKTQTSAVQPLRIVERSVDLPPPAAAKMPMRCPSPQVSTPSSDRIPRERGFEMRMRVIGLGAGAKTG